MDWTLEEERWLKALKTRRSMTQRDYDYILRQHILLLNSKVVKYLVENPV